MGLERWWKSSSFAILPQDLICFPGKHLGLFVFLSSFWHVVVHEESKRNIPLTGSLLSPYINHWHGNETILTKKEMDRGIQMQKHYTHIHPFPSSPPYHIKALHQLEQLLNGQLGMQQKSDMMLKGRKSMWEDSCTFNYHSNHFHSFHMMADSANQ